LGGNIYDIDAWPTNHPDQPPHLIAAGSVYSSPGAPLTKLPRCDPDSDGPSPLRLVVGGYFTCAAERVSPFIALWGRNPCACPGDADGFVDFADLAEVLSNFGLVCN
jgi:hypothetical protein